MANSVDVIGTEAFWVATSALATVALLCVTAAYVWVTYRMLQAAREQLWVSSRPRMLVAARTNQGGQFLLIHVENVGVSPARNLKLTIDRPVHRNFGKKEDLREIPLFRNGLRALPPDTPSRFGLGTSFEYLTEEIDRAKHPLAFTVTTTYEHDGRTIRDSFPIDIEDQYAWSSIERDNLDEFSRKFPDEFNRAAGDIVRALESLSSASGSIEIE
jgi:hypothetical protein